MFDWFKRSRKMEFYTFMKEITLDESVAPSVSTKEINSFMKKVKTQYNENGFKKNTIKKCPGIIEYINNGAIIKSWKDIVIETDESGDDVRWEFPVNDFDHRTISNDKSILYPTKDVDFFAKEVFFNFFPRENTLKGVIKINTPWFIKLPPGYSALILPVWYDNETRFSVIPGILQTDYLEKINIQIYCHSLGKREVIKSGTPLAKIIPIKNEKWDIDLREMRQTDIDKFNFFQIIHRGKSFEVNWKKFTKIIDSMRSKKKCPW